MSIYHLTLFGTFLLFIFLLSDNNLKDIDAKKFQDMKNVISQGEYNYLNFGYSGNKINPESYNYNKNEFGILSVEIDALSILDDLILDIKIMELSDHNSKYAVKRLMLASLNNINKVLNDGNTLNDIVICDRMVSSFNNELQKYFRSGIIEQNNKEKIEQQILLFKDLICKE
ncbi:MAG: hypothetical protein ACPKQO_04430 [Nitrososphaeraceae archaeon]